METLKEIVIIYFSGTGNTKIVTDEIANLFETKGFNVELIPVENVEKIKSVDLSDKILGIGFPIYGWNYQHELFDKVIEYLGKQNKKVPAFLFCTWGKIGVGMELMARKLKQYNIYTIIHKPFKCPSSGWGTFISEKSMWYKHSNSFDENLFVNIKKYVEETIRRLEKFQRRPFAKLGFAKLGFTIPIAHALVKLNEWFEKKSLFNNLTIDKEKCIKCGLCVKKCPVGNIIEKDDEIEIVDRNNCLFCGRCISICPKGAILWGSKRRYRIYTKEYRDELLTKVKRLN